MLLEVCKQNIHISEPVTLVSGTIGEYVAQFIFHEGWDDYAAVAVFKHSSGVLYEQLIGDASKVLIPYEVLQDPGYLIIGVYGVKDDKLKPTIWSTPIKISIGTDTDGLEPEEPTKTAVEQLLDLFKGGDAGEHIEKNSDDDFDFSWKDPPEELPDVDAEDNGKVLAVVNGSWAKKELYSEVENSAGGITANINTL